MNEVRIPPHMAEVFIQIYHREIYLDRVLL